jgi:Protein of unknown function (DUF1553)/Protein of unknown function (DUF1549)/Planctomycete cytochrome C
MYRQLSKSVTSWCWAATLAVAAPVASLQATEKPQYNRDVRPILAENCFPCHGPDHKARKADLRLDVRTEAVKLGAIVPGNPGESELIERIFTSDKKKRMPPPKAHKTLTQKQKEMLRSWIAAEAEYQPHWAYIAPMRPPLPRLQDSSQVENAIDAFIQQTLAAKGLKPSPEADRARLLRRLSLDLIGLPPTPEEVRAFVNDFAPNAYEKQVDRLLQSHHYGERMAQHWLDVARYADTVGYHGDQNQNAWAYRDYVIHAFNDNKPFDQFTLEQLAGDLLPHPTAEQRTATCFNRLNMMTREGGAQVKEYLAKYTADRIRTVGLAWLGSTLNCCECHDHKFDPFTMKDFYSIGAFFADIKQWGVYQDYDYTPNPELKGWSNDHPWPPEIVVDSPALHRRMDRLKKEITETVAGARPAANALLNWRQEVLAFLKEHPSGWETPAPVVHIGQPAVTKKAKKGTKDEAVSLSAAKNGSSGTQLSSVKIDEKDRRIVFGNMPPASAEMELQLNAGWLTAVKLELLPEGSHGNKIVRSGDATTIRVSWAIIRKDGTKVALPIRHAQADHYRPHYANGFEIIGVQDAWTTDPKAVRKPHTAVYFFDSPIRLSGSDRLQVHLAENTLSSIRLSTSPLAPLNLSHPEFAAHLASVAAGLGTVPQRGDGGVLAFYLRSTGWNRAAFDRLKTLEAQLLDCRDGKTAVMVTEQTDKPLTVRVLPRGNWMDDSGAICQPQTPACLPRMPNSDGRKLTRLDLARWLCAPENPLTARTIVNRFWRQFFGAGLCTQVDDLGTQGEPPSHPELLDWLATEFRTSGWNIKHIVKLIVMSHTYRQSSQQPRELRELDPNNRLLSCQNPRRLEAEVVRDNALAIAGLLSLDVGGPPCMPYQPAHYYEGLQFPDREYIADRGEDQYRRGVYMHWQRTFLHPMLANFDAPSREDCIALRTSANSPQQALTLLNDPTFVEAARVWAAKLLAPPALSDAQRLKIAFERALARPPTAEETSSLLSFLTHVRAQYRTRPDDAARLLEVGFSPTPRGSSIELAAWTNLCRAILNLHETITRF